MFITGPQVIKTVTAGRSGCRNLRGAMTHNAVSGVAHFVAANDEDCLAQIRYLLSFLPNNNLETAPVYDSGDSPTRMEEALNSALNDDPSIPYDMKNIIKLIVDKGGLRSTAFLYF